MAVRAHYAPVFSRLGPYDRDVLDRAAWGPRSARLLAEYWAHEAALMAVDDWPLLRWRMRQYRHGRWGTHIVKANPQLAEDIVAAVAELGPSTAGQIEAHLAAEPRTEKGHLVDPQRHQVGRRGAVRLRACSPPPPGWASLATTTWWSGCCRRSVLAREVDDDEAVRELTLRAATALGVGTEADIRDYFRLSAQQVKPAIAELGGGR